MEEALIPAGDTVYRTTAAGTHLLPSMAIGHGEQARHIQGIHAAEFTADPAGRRQQASLP